MERILPATIVAAAVLTASVALGATANLVCEGGKLKTSGSYSSCILKAQGKAVLANSSADTSKCDTTLLKFYSYESKAGNGVCPSQQDEPAIKNFLDACLDEVTLHLAGGALPLDENTCLADLSTTNADLSNCLLTCSSTTRAPLKTGASVTTGAGSDGALQKGAARSFTDNGNGTITDNVTGLMWEKKDRAGGVHDVGNTYSWSLGMADDQLDGTVSTAFLATLNAGSGFAGHKDWRLPNRYELESLLDLGTTNPAVYPAFQSGCVASCTVTTCSCSTTSQPFYYWSSTTASTLFPQGAWFVDLGDGARAEDSKSAAYHARAVRDLP